MKIGKVSQTVLKRSILKPLQFHREESLIDPSVEEKCYGIKVGAEEEVLSRMKRIWAFLHLHRW